MSYERTDTNFWSRLHVARRRPKKSYAASVTRSLCAFGMSPACIIFRVINGRKTRAGWDRDTSERRAMTVAEDRQVPVSRREARSARRMRHFRQAHDRLVITPTELRTLSSVVELCTYVVKQCKGPEFDSRRVHFFFGNSAWSPSISVHAIGVLHFPSNENRAISFTLTCDSNKTLLNQNLAHV